MNIGVAKQPSPRKRRPLSTSTDTVNSSRALSTFRFRTVGCRSIATTAAARLQVPAELPRLRRIDPLSHEVVLSNSGKVGVALHAEANQRGPDLIGKVVAHA